ncbi:MAG: CapA family protein [Actinomycetes bacterium]
MASSAAAGAASARGRESVTTLALCGDVMLGRGIDQILPRPGDPTLRETRVRDARDYVELAEAVNGRIPRPVDFSWPWGDALTLLDDAAPEVRLVNLETGVTRCADFAPGKPVHYRMSPANLPCLGEARLDVCALANNHVLDFGQLGLAETLDALSGAGLRPVGAGRDVEAAWLPAAVPLPAGRRMLVYSFGTGTSGIAPRWSATGDRPGVAYLTELSKSRAVDVCERARQARRPGDVVVASIHWGSNWGYDVSRDQVAFAHRLIDGGVDVVHGHSSHHPRPIEVYRSKLILYGCGDFINDYEGITGHESYRSDLRLLYLVSMEPDTGAVTRLRMLPLQSQQLQLRHASRDDVRWLRTVLDRTCHPFGSRVDIEPDGVLALRIPRAGR